MLTIFFSVTVNHIVDGALNRFLENTFGKGYPLAHKFLVGNRSNQISRLFLEEDNDIIEARNIFERNLISSACADGAFFAIDV